MLFGTIEFGIFLVVVFYLFWLVSGAKQVRTVLLLAASYFFYASWDYRYLVLIWISTGLDYTIGLLLGRETRPGRRKLWLLISIAGNLGILGYFKYFKFFVDSFVLLLAQAGLHVDVSIAKLVVPLGLSFYTFQTLSYTFDVYLGKIKPTRSLLEFAVFVAFFPQLVAGPIVRASQFLPQFRREPRLGATEFYSGLYQVLIGLFKKLVIADLLAVYLVDPYYADPGHFGLLRAWLTLYGFALVMYCDFSGYADVAIGTARMLGFEIPMNFNRPLASASVAEFWRRWHISLSTWMRDYVYIPLGGSRCGQVLRMRNLVITFALVGLWHGANGRMLLFGLLHALAIIGTLLVQRLVGLDRTYGRAVRAAGIVATFTFFAFTLISYRSENLPHYLDVVSRLFAGPWGAGVPPSLLAVMGLGLATHVIPLSAALKSQRRFAEIPLVAKAGVVALVLAACAVSKTAEIPYLYFAF